MVSSSDKALSMLSIAAKAGKVVSGGFMTENSILDNSARLVIIASDASANTQKKFVNKCKYYKVPYVIFSDAHELGRRIGKENRTSVSVTDDGLAKQILNNLDSSKDMEV